MSSETDYFKDELVAPDWMNKDFFEMVLRQSENDSLLMVCTRCKSLVKFSYYNFNRFQIMKLTQLLVKMTTFPVTSTE